MFPEMYIWKLDFESMSRNMVKQFSVNKKSYFIILPENEGLCRFKTFELH